MSLEKQVEELEKEILAEDAKGKEAAEVEADDDEDEEIEEQEAVKGEEAAESDDEADDDEVAKDDAPKTNADFAKLRKELAAAKKELKEKELARYEAAKKAEPVAEVKDGDPEPDKSDVQGHMAWELRQTRKELAEIKEKTAQKDPDIEEIKREKMINQAEKEFDGYVGKIGSDDAHDRVNHVIKSVYAGLKAMNPGMPHEAIANATKMHVLQMASGFMKQGYENPAQAMYDLAEEHYGYVKVQKEEKAEEKKPKVDLKKIEESKKKSYTPAAAGGRNGKGKGLPDANSMSVADLEKLSQEELEDLVEDAA